MFVLPQVADVSDVRSEIAAMSGVEVTLLVVVALWNLATYALVWMAGLFAVEYALSRLWRASAQRCRSR